MASIGAVLGHSFGGVATLSPLSVDSGLVLWLKADSLSLNDADPVSSWTDSSGNSNTASGTLTARPLYKTNIINSLPVVRFDGSNDFLTITRNSGLEPTGITLFAVVRAASAVAASKYLISKKFTTGSFASYALQEGAAATARTLVKVATTGNITGNGIADATIWDGSGHLIVLSTARSLMTNYFDGTPMAANATAVGNLQYDSNDLYLGSYDGTQLFAAFDLAELLIYNSALTIKKIGQVSNYLGQKWNLTV